MGNFLGTVVGCHGVDSNPHGTWKPIRGRTTCPAKFNRCVHLPALKAICNGQAGFFLGDGNFFTIGTWLKSEGLKVKGSKGKVATARKIKE